MPIFESSLPDIEIPDSPVTPYVLRHVDRLAEKPALIDGTTGEVTSYRALRDRVRRFAGGLGAQGIGRGDVVALMLPNIPEFVVAFHGTSTVGGTVTTVNPACTTEELGVQLADCKARLVVTTPELMTTVRKAGPGSSARPVVCVGEGEGGVPYADFLGESFDGTAEVDPAVDVAALPYSSGTTGFPKGVMLTHRNLVANLEQMEVLEVGEDDVVLAVLPFFHIYGMQVLMNVALSRGATVVTLARFEMEAYLETLQRNRVTRAFVVPPIVLALANDPLVDRYDLGSLRQVFSAAAPLGSELAAKAAARIGVEVAQGYGMTEASPATHLTPLGRFRAGSVGTLIPGTRCRIVDPDTSEDRSIGEDGEIWIRGPQVMRGYLGSPEATAATITQDGWLRTGDVGHVDEDGYLYVTDRLKELIKYKGFQVAPAELEALLLTHPAVADAAVVPQADAEAGEIPHAFVVLGEQGTDAEALMGFVAEHVTHYKRVRRVTFVDSIPKSPSGKILRRLLRDRTGSGAE